MKSARLSFIGFISLFCITSLFIALAGTLNLDHILHESIWGIQIFFIITILLSHFIAGMGIKDKENAISWFLGSIGLRFIFSLFFIFFMVYFFESNRIILVVNFFALYLIYMAFEFFSLLTNLRPN